jgi:hypothetical protein
MNGFWEPFLIGIASTLTGGVIVYILRRFLLKAKDAEDRPARSQNMPYVAAFTLLFAGALFVYLGSTNNDKGTLEFIGIFIIIMAFVMFMIAVATTTKK